ncbi:uncharacterized protein LOC114387215 [Glycine soja]|uniref:FAR1 domain-containing protein n=1 Tax=Glycine soja TaxID=3848 RepID=A0A445GXW2_GLYSO|nr:uncharacterized protein LOC114387215 [Glycine soja]RZB66115.1 hypothetical protein D0Y65_041963 [Glycine soja]RZB66116.1 hypothetical protein D0Y65_041963 [Glycine soja]
MNSAAMNSASIYYTQHPTFKNGTMLPFAHCLFLFSLRCAMLPSLRLVWFGERLGCVKVKVHSGVRCCNDRRRHTAYEMDGDQWMYEGIMPKEVDMDYENEEECGVNEPHVYCSDAFNTSQVFDSREDVLRWARSVAYENGFMTVLVRSDRNTGSRGRTSFVLIDCERSGEYKCMKKEFVRRDTGTRKCGCPFKLRRKPVVGGQG